MKLFYLLILIVLYYIASLYHVTALMLITLSLFVLFVIMMITIHLAKVDVHVPEQSVINEDDDQIVIDIHNHSSFPINKMIILMTTEDPFHHKQKFRLRVSVRSKEEKTVAVHVDSTHLGKIQFYYRKCLVYDLIGLFKKSISLKQEQWVYVLPSARKMNLNFDADTNREGASFNMNGRGDDDDYTIRDYHSGDSLKSVHWNMSARFNQLYIKEYDQQVESLFLLNLSYDYHKGQNLDSFYQVLYHLAFTLLDHFQLIIDETTHTVLSEPMEINDIHDLDQLMLQLYDHQEENEGQMSDGYSLNTDCELYHNGQLLIDFKGGEDDAFTR